MGVFFLIRLGENIEAPELYLEFDDKGDGDGALELLFVEDVEDWFIKFEDWDCWINNGR